MPVLLIAQAVRWSHKQAGLNGGWDPWRHILCGHAVAWHRWYKHPSNNDCTAVNASCDVCALLGNNKWTHCASIPPPGRRPFWPFWPFWHPRPDLQTPSPPGRTTTFKLNIIKILKIKWNSRCANKGYKGKFGVSHTKDYFHHNINRLLRLKMELVYTMLHNNDW